MRFTANGPSIPDELLVARDAGDVILFCGAGVSQQEAGLPNFAGLGRKVIQLLGAAQDSRARLLLERALTLDPMPGVGGLVATDRVFGLLEREFEVADVRAAVAEAIRPRPDAGLGAHRVLLDIATSNGTTRLVTTNFDLLFEACDPALRSSGPPNLPDPRSDRDFQGVVHLHGRVGLDYRGAQDDEFVISSSDFGRAYLSIGWATRFIQALLSRFQILFVGYTADDPPVQYLLEGLNLKAGTRNRLYAFQNGDERSAVALWEHRGVQAIPFDSFAGLWDTLQCWGARARDERGWTETTLSRASSGPKELLPHERGQVAHLLMTTAGVSRIAASAQPLSAEWLLVADPKQRYATPGRTILSEEAGSAWDPFESLGLDDDPPPGPMAPDEVHRDRPIPVDALDLLRSNVLDQGRSARSSAISLNGPADGFNSELPPRLASISSWLRRVAHEPVALWWAAHQRGLHPAVISGITSALTHDGGRFPKHILRGWRMLFLAWGDRRPDPSMLKYDIERRARQEGWTASLVRELVGLYRPQCTARPAYGTPHPIVWKQHGPTEDVIYISVEYPHPHEGVEVPDSFLTYAIACFRQNIEFAIALEEEISGTNRLYLQTSRAPDGGPDLPDGSYGLTGPVVHFQKLMVRLSAIDLAAARDQARSWPTDDEYVFARLRIWAAGSGLLDRDEAGAALTSLSDRVFWGSVQERDLLYALRDRWADLTELHRRCLEERLLRGSYPWESDTSGKEVELAAHDRLNRLHWLSTQGVAFTFDVDKTIEVLQSAAPRWTMKEGDAAANSNAPQVYSITTDSRPEPLLGVPVADILRRSEELAEVRFEDRTERDPFRGLAVAKPARALAALTRALRSGEAPRWAWYGFLSADIRAKDPARMVRVIAGRLCMLSPSALHELAYPVSQWMETGADRFYGDVTDALPGLWEAMIVSLRQQRGNELHRPRHSWAAEALNAPVGKLFSVVMKDPRTKGLKLGSGFPAHWKAQIDDLLNLPADLRRQALVMVGHQTTWLFAIDRAWTESWLLQLLDDEGIDGDAFWEGLLWGATLPSRALYGLIKEALLLYAARDRGQKGRGEATVLAGFLLAGWGSVGDDGKPLIQDEELREVLIHSSNEFRQQLIWQIERWCAEPKASWRKKVVPFFAHVWPKQRALRTPTVSRSLANFALTSGDIMPEVVKLILPRLVPIRDSSLRLDAVLTGKNEALAPNYSRALLDLLWAVLGEDASTWPYRTEETLDRLAQDLETAADPRLSELRRRLELRW